MKRFLLPLLVVLTMLSGCILTDWLKPNPDPIPDPPVEDPIDIPAFNNPMMPDTPESQDFRTKYQMIGHAHHEGVKNQWRIKWAWPSYAVTDMGATEANSKTKFLLPDGSTRTAKIWDIDEGDAGINRCLSGDLWFGIGEDAPAPKGPVVAQLWSNGKQLLQAVIRNPAAPRNYRPLTWWK